jgi:hypothetical protein
MKFAFFFHLQPSVTVAWTLPSTILITAKSSVPPPEERAFIFITSVGVVSLLEWRGRREPAVQRYSFSLLQWEDSHYLSGRTVHTHVEDYNGLVTSD